MIVYVAVSVSPSVSVPLIANVPNVAAELLVFELEDTIAPFVGLVGTVIPESIAPVRVRVPVPMLSIEPEAEESATLKGCVLVTSAERLYIYRAPVL